jgi:hypothetical protein
MPGGSVPQSAEAHVASRIVRSVDGAANGLAASSRQQTTTTITKEACDEPLNP